MKRRFSLVRILSVQACVAGVLAAAYAAGSRGTQNEVREALTGAAPPTAVRIRYRDPLRIEPLYDEPDVVSDEELAAVLERVQPKFPADRLSPNFVEHALRTWGASAVFSDPAAMSGEQMRDFLIDHQRYRQSWNEDVPPLLEPQPGGVAIRWGREDGASVHHDHLLACLTEAGVPLDQPVFPPNGRKMHFGAVLQQALRDFRLDEREVEWSAMGFGLWLPPRNHWQTSDGRRMSFDLLARRLLRGHRRYGVCSGTHRVYSLVLLLRLNDLPREPGTEPLLSPDVAADVWDHLLEVRHLITVSQFADGHWPANWYDGAEAVSNPRDDENYKKVIATGHHLEWLAIAPLELHPPQEQIERAADWLIRDVTSQNESELLDAYTFYSHVGNALALWRNTHPAEFWSAWEATHGPSSRK